jgi:hypothetical protein
MNADEIRGSATSPSNGKRFALNHVGGGVDGHLSRDTGHEKSGRKEKARE